MKKELFRKTKQLHIEIQNDLKEKGLKSTVHMDLGNHEENVIFESYCDGSCTLFVKVGTKDILQTKEKLTLKSLAKEVSSRLEKKMREYENRLVSISENNDYN